MRLITLSFFAFLLAVSAFGQEQGENTTTNEEGISTYLPLLVGLISSAVGGIVRWFFRMAVWSNTILWMGFGSLVGGVFMFNNFRVGPILCLALFGCLIGSLVGDRERRWLGTAIGFGIGCLFAGFAGGGPLPVLPESPAWWISVESRWWFFASFAALGGLVGLHNKSGKP